MSLLRRMLGKGESTASLAERHLAEVDQLIEASQAFLTAPSLNDCRSVVDKYPVLLTEKALRHVGVSMAWVPEAAQTAMRERLDWLSRLQKSRT